MSDYLVGDIVDRCLNTWLLGTYSAQYNTLGADITATTTELDCSLPVGEIGRGSFIAIDDELASVIERDATNNRIVVVRGVRGTLAATHTQDTAIEVNPRFPRYMVRTAMREELDSWPESLYAAKQFTAELASCAGTIPVAETVDNFPVRHVVRVRRASLSTSDARLRLTDGWAYEPDLDGGGTIMLDVEAATTTSFTVTAACAFRSEQILEVGDECDLLDDVGLVAGMVEILELGAAYRLLIARGAVRLFPEAEGQSRSATEVGARDIPTFAASLAGLRGRAEAREAQRLISRFGFGGG